MVDQTNELVFNVLWSYAMEYVGIIDRALLRSHANISLGRQSTAHDLVGAFPIYSR